MYRKLKLSSPFYSSRGENPLDMIVIHHIGSRDGKLYGVRGTITWFTNEEVHRNKKTGKIENKVSAHYIIPRSPYKEHEVIQCVEDKDVAWHAGRSEWVVGGKLRKGINKYSIGIELEGDGNLVEYTEFQYRVLAELIKDLMADHGISADNIVGHEDISPRRKVDPGEKFDWVRLKKDIKTCLPDKIDPVVPHPSDEESESKLTKNRSSEFYMESGESGEAEYGTPTGSILQSFVKFFLKFFS